jgi:hypothetical protein
VIVGVIGPIGSGLPQFGFPRRFAMNYCLSTRGNMNFKNVPNYKILRRGLRILGKDPAGRHLQPSTGSHDGDQETLYVSGDLRRKSMNFSRFVATNMTVSN